MRAPPPATLDGPGRPRRRPRPTFAREDFRLGDLELADVLSLLRLAAAVEPSIPAEVVPSKATIVSLVERPATPLAMTSIY